MVNTLEILALRHNEWLKMVRSFGADRDTAHDIVQEMYLKMHKYVPTPERIMFSDTEVNTFFVFVVLRNLYASHMKSEQREISAYEYTEEASMAEQEAFEDLLEAIWEEVEGWHWYDNKLFKVYHGSGMTIKKISEETKISERSIWNTLDNGKKRIQSNCKDKYKAWQEAKRAWGHD